MVRPLLNALPFRNIPAYEKFNLIFVFFCDFDGHILVKGRHGGQVFHYYFWCD